MACAGARIGVVPLRRGPFRSTRIASSSYYMPARWLLRGLKRLEYRGYDSAGVAVMDTEGKINVVKKKGKIASLRSAVEGKELPGTVGMAHTRWSTHGEPSDVNSHPLCSADGTVAVVHNGIIENFSSLRKALIQEGYTFVSETDTEVLAHLIHSFRAAEPTIPLDEVVRLALRQVRGAFGICVMFAEQPDLLIGARRGSPLILGVMDGEYILASDSSAIVEHTRDVVILEENEMAIVHRGSYTITSTELDPGDMADGADGADAAAAGNGARPVRARSASGPKYPKVIRLEASVEDMEKGGYDHFMLKEIMEQPEVLRNCMRGRVFPEEGRVHLGGIEPFLDRIAGASRLIFCACGTSFHAAMVGEYLIESMARIPVEVEFASEFRYRQPLLFPNDVVIAVSQSGETADTLAAIQLAKEHGALTLGLVNVVGSSIARATDAGAFLHVGPEIGVASTKAFTGQVCAMLMLSLRLAVARQTLPEEEIAQRVRLLWESPSLVQRVLEQRDKVATLSNYFRFASSFLYLGRGFNFPVALEGALKLKEISYIHAEGYAAAEMKHGPIALIDKFLPVVFIAPSRDAIYEKIKSNLETVRAREGLIIAITEEDNFDLDDRCEAILRVPATAEWLAPLLTVIPLQLLAYYVARLRKCDVDQPRNLAKSVTVE